MGSGAKLRALTSTLARFLALVRLLALATLCHGSFPYRRIGLVQQPCLIGLIGLGGGLG